LPTEPNVAIDVEKTKGILLDDNNFKDLSTVREHDMPRASYMLRNYYAQYYRLINFSIETNDIETGRALFTAMRRNLPEDIVPLGEVWKSRFQRLENKLNGLENN
jgi:hypothetical protein